jgi:ribA/ribD-fused uncharacterized protein
MVSRIVPRETLAPKEIHFFGPNGEYGWLDPFYQLPSREGDFILKIDGVRYKTQEHYYQSRKALYEEDRKRIAYASSPAEAKKIANALGDDKKVKDWERVKVAIWKEGARAKFFQNPKLAQWLLSTGDSKIFEDHLEDEFWGWPGKNTVGRLLEEVRAELKDTSRRYGVIVDDNST